MTTVAEVIEETRALLRGPIEEQSSTLQNAIDASALSLVLTDTRSITLGATPGVIEIELEQIYASVIDAMGNVTVPPWGRGHRNTTPAAHPANARVISQPQYGRQRILDKLNDTCNRMFPSVYGIKHFNATATEPVRTYNTPDDLERVLTVEWQVPDGAQDWLTVRRWKTNAGGRPTTADGNNPDQGVTVTVGDYMIPGRPVHFVYAAKPGLLVNEADSFETVTGFASSLKDVCVYGAAAALIIANETSRMQLTSIEQQDRTSKITPSAALSASRYLEQEFQTRLAEERKTLQQLYPPRVTGQWL